MIIFKQIMENVIVSAQYKYIWNWSLISSTKWIIVYKR